MSAEQSSVNSETVEKTKQQIRGLVGEISALSKSELNAEEYYAEFLQRVVQALAAVGGAIWTVGQDRRMDLAYQINLSDTLLDASSDEAERHTRLLDYVAQSDEGRLVPPLSGASDDRAGGNPTRFLLVLCPLRADGKVEGLVEIFQRPDSPPATQRGYLRFVEQMGELAGEWLKTQQLRQFTDRHSLWAQADQFSRQVHESLDLRETAYAVANEGRRLIGCDRVSVGVMRGRKCLVDAVSGQDALENRSNIVNLLSRLATRVVATGEPLWYEGSTDDLPPQIEKAIDAYVDESYSKTIAVLPLRRPKSANQAARDASEGAAERDDHHTGDVIGALIVEQIESKLPRPVMMPRVDLVYEHSSRAVANSMEHTNLFLMPVWRALGRLSWIVRARTLPKTLAVAGLILVIIAVLTFGQRDFYLKAKGSLQPVDKSEVFVAISGTVIEKKVEDQQIVEKDQVLLILRNTDLDVQLEDVLGQKQSTSQQLISARETRVLQGKLLSEEEAIRLDGQIAEMTVRLESLTRQHDLLIDKRKLLEIRAPIAGQVMLAWDVEKSLMNRTVEVGQVLMSVADLSGKWEVELFMPERRMGHIDTARKDGSGSRVDYILATEPETERTGEVHYVQKITQMHEEEGHSVQICVNIEDSEINEPRPGTTVTGKILCGRRAIGYTWFHEAVEWAQANILF
ncbi:MAG: HlyD family efflux transporter periplasmic adaptor subunit [Pirellulaceae bacterium]|nr:HlyD family efflux transporter periplasmic adaptor subunit [Pirellulaceae bacterium]